MGMTVTNGAVDETHGWGDDPFEPPMNADIATDSVRHRAFGRPPTISVSLNATSRAVDAKLGLEAHRILLLALTRCTTYEVAEFGPGEIAQLLGIVKQNVSRGLGQLKRADIIDKASTPQHIVFLAEDVDID